MASNPAFVYTPRLAVGQVSSANTNRDGTGTIVDILTGSGRGTKIEKVRIQAIVTTTAGLVRLFVYTGAAYRLYQEVSISATTVSSSTGGYGVEVTFTDLVLPDSTWKLAASTHNAETFNVIAMGGDL